MPVTVNGRTYADGDPNTPSSGRTKANGWNGSKYMGGVQAAPPAAAAAPTPTAPSSSIPQNGTVNVTAPGFNPSRPGAAVEAIGTQNVQNNQARAAQNQPATQTGQPQGTGGGPTQWLDWIARTYGNSKTRGGGFADLPAGVTLESAIQRYNAETGAGARYVGGNSQDKADFGNGVVDALTGEGQLWYNYGPGGPPGGPRPASSGGGGGGGSYPDLEALKHDGIPGNYAAAVAARRGGGSTTATGSSSTQSGISGELYDILMGRVKQGTVIDPNDPNIKQQSRPYAAAQERARRDYLADLAERSGPQANLRGEERLASERAGQATGMFESELVGRELVARRDEIKHAIDSLGNRLSVDQQQALQKELAYLEDATRRYGIKTDAATAAKQIDLGQDRLGLDYNYFDWTRDPANPNNLPRG